MLNKNILKNLGVWLYLDSSYTGQVIILVILLLMSGFFSMSETALMSLSKIRIRNMVDEGVKGVTNSYK